MTGDREETGPAQFFGPLLVFTAAELGVLERAHLAAGMPAAEPGAAAEPGVARESDETTSEAARSLLSRGLLGHDGRLDQGTAPADLAELLLDVRLGAAALIVIERRIAGREDRPDLRLLHLIPEGGVVEDVHPEGLYGFDLHVDPTDLVQAALAPILPSDAVPGSGHTRHIDPSHPELMAQVLDEPGVLAELTLAAADGQRVESHLLAVSRSGCFLSRRPPESDEPAPDSGSDGHLAFAPVSPQDVQDLVNQWVCTTVEPVDGPSTSE